MSIFKEPTINTMVDAVDGPKKERGPAYPDRIILGEGWPIFSKPHGQAVALENTNAKASGLIILKNPGLEDGPEAEGITYRLVLERCTK